MAELETVKMNELPEESQSKEDFYAIGYKGNTSKRINLSMVGDVPDAPDDSAYLRSKGRWVKSDSPMDTVTKTLADYERLAQGLYISWEEGVGYSISQSTVWESWAIPAEGLKHIVATLGLTNHINHCNIVFYKSADITNVNEIISHIHAADVGEVTFNVTDIPTGCKYVVLSNRILTLATPTATLTFERNLSVRVDILEQTATSLGARVGAVEEEIGGGEEVKTLADYERLVQGLYIGWEEGIGYSISQSTVWENWAIPAGGLKRIVATLGLTNHINHCNIVFYKSADITNVNEIISHIHAVDVGEVTFNVTDIPTGCKYVVLSNRTSTLATPTATLTFEQSLSVLSTRVGALEQTATLLDTRVGAVEEEIESVKGGGFYKSDSNVAIISQYSGVIAQYDELVTACPNYITKYDLGVSSDNVNHLYEYVMTAGNYNTAGQRGYDSEIVKPKILLMAGVHGYEPASVMSLMTVCQAICKGDESLRAVRAGFEIHVIPVVNPYGHNQNRRGNYNNVDINRNFNANWVLTGDPTDNPSYYSGLSAASEKETQIVQHWMDSNTDAKMMIDFHNSSFLEVSCLGGAGGDNMSVKKQYLYAVTELESYFKKLRQITDDYVIAYSYGANYTTPATSRAYAQKIGIMGGGTLETCVSTNTWQAPDSNSVAIGAECLGNMLRRFIELYQ